MFTQSTRLIEKIQQRDFKLNALLDITLAINANLKVEELLMQYEKVLRENLSIEKLVLFTKEDNWSCLLKYGIAEGDIPDVADEKFFTQSSEVKLRQESFDIVIPILHEEKPIAYLLVGDVEEGMKISPVIKHMKFIQTLTNVLVVAIENRQLQQESLRQAQVKRELELAAEMQAILLPTHLPKNEFYEAASFYKSHQQVGGDYYDFVELNKDEVMFCMADVSGKGVSAAFLMANFQAYLRSIFSYQRTDLVSLVEELNEQVMHSAMGEKYITLFLATYNKSTRMLQYINCGHNPPVLADDHGYTQLLKLGSIGLGMFDEIPKIAMGELKLAANSTVVCYTDGLVEPENANLEEFGIERLEQTVLANYAKNITDINNAIITALNQFKGDMPYTDDVALLSCRFF
ncbi:MAG: PP2C family protein-serine/threonine phosphatase [Flavobacteriales bacterium]|nr:PP2C family protein-serine/threonine phosphatase [Flavobacteriales bacterium]